MDRKRTNFDRSLAILIRSSATSALFTAHTQATVAPRSAHDGADGPLGDASWRRRRRDHGVPHGVAESPRTGGMDSKRRDELNDSQEPSGRVFMSGDGGSG